MRWTEMERRQPHLAALGRQRLIEPGVLLIATVRRDGTPRLSPVEPFVMDGDLGTAQVEDDPFLQRRYATAVAAHLGWQPEPGRFHLFSIDIEGVVYIRYDDTTGDQYLAAWPQGRESVRRGTSATSVGSPEPRHELLVPD